MYLKISSKSFNRFNRYGYLLRIYKWSVPVYGLSLDSRELKYMEIIDTTIWINVPLVTLFDINILEEPDGPSVAFWNDGPVLSSPHRK